MPERLPEVLLRVAVLGPIRFEWVTGGAKNAPGEGMVGASADKLAGTLGVPVEELKYLTAKGIHSRRKLLAASAVLVGQQAEDMERIWGDLAELPMLPERRARHLPIHRDSNEYSVNRTDALKVIAADGWEWNESERRVKRPRDTVTGMEQGNRPSELLTQVATELYREWHEDGEQKIVTVRKVAHALRWFFHPEQLREPRFPQRIRDNL